MTNLGKGRPRRGVMLTIELSWDVVIAINVGADALERECWAKYGREEDEPPTAR